MFDPTRSNSPLTLFGTKRADWVTRSEMTNLDIAILVVAVLVLLTFVWSMRSARTEPPRPRRRDGLQRRTKERDLL
jgi:hypothetical protein